MLRAAQDSIQTAADETLPPAAETIPLYGNCCWQEKPRPGPHLKVGKILAWNKRAPLRGKCAAEIIQTREPLFTSEGASLNEAPAPPQVSARRPYCEYMVGCSG